MSITIAKPKDDLRLQIDLETLLFLFVLGLILLIRVTNLNYNSLFVDEAANLLGGHDLLIGRFDRSITTWFGGSYLYPLIVTFADSLGGVWGARLVSAILTTLTAVFVYLAAQKLFGRRPAFWAMTIFGLTGASISLGQMAVYDVLCLPFLALAFYLLVEAVHREGRSERNYLLAAGLSYAVAVLGKYTAIFYLPALGLFASALYEAQSRRHGIPRLVGWFLLPAGLLLGAYVFHYFNDLVLVFSSQGFQAATRLEVLQVIWEEAGVAVLLAVTGVGMLFLFATRIAQTDPAPLLRTITGYIRPRRRFTLTAAILAAVILVIAFLALPLFQLASANIRSLWKNVVSSLIFLSPFAGYAVETAIRRFLSFSSTNTLRFRLLGTALTVLGLFFHANYAINRNWGFQNSWPDISGAVDYIKSNGFGKDSRMLVEGGAAFEYYFGTGRQAGGVWADTWYMSYAGLQGVDAMKTAIRDRGLDFVVLSSHDTPELTSQLVTALREAGYRVGYEDLQRLSVGVRRVQVYVK